MLNYLGRKQYLFASSAIKSGDGYAPQSLPGNAPVTPFGQHAAHAFAPPCGHPGRDPGLIKGCLPERFRSASFGIHRDEPLRRCSKDHRILAAPAMRIAVSIVLGEQ